MNFFFEIYKDIPREGPGENKFTKMAFNMLTGLDEQVKMLNIGCGSGEHTVELVNNVDGQIYIMDGYEPFLNKIDKYAEEKGLSDKVQTVFESYYELDKHFEQEFFDVIWAEDSINIIGFENALNDWEKYLKKDGYMVIIDISWLKSNLPEEVVGFWSEKYPHMKRVDENMILIESSGYKVVGTITLPEKICWEKYYEPVTNNIETLREKFRNDLEKNQELNELESYLQMYNKYSEYYGYVFYIMQKI